MMGKQESQDPVPPDQEFRALSSCPCESDLPVWGMTDEPIGYQCTYRLGDGRGIHGEVMGKLVRGNSSPFFKDVFQVFSSARGDLEQEMGFHPAG